MYHAPVEGRNTVMLLFEVPPKSPATEVEMPTRLDTSTERPLNMFEVFYARTTK